MGQVSASGPRNQRGHVGVCLTARSASWLSTVCGASRKYTSGRASAVGTLSTSRGSCFQACRLRCTGLYLCTVVRISDTKNSPLPPPILDNSDRQAPLRTMCPQLVPRLRVRSVRRPLLRACGPKSPSPRFPPKAGTLGRGFWVRVPIARGFRFLRSDLANCATIQKLDLPGSTRATSGAAPCTKWRPAGRHPKLAESWQGSSRWSCGQTRGPSA